MFLKDSTELLKIEIAKRSIYTRCGINSVLGSPIGNLNRGEITATNGGIKAKFNACRPKIFFISFVLKSNRRDAANKIHSRAPLTMLAGQ